MADFLIWFFSTIWPWVSGRRSRAGRRRSRVGPRRADQEAIRGRRIGWVGIIWLTPLLGAILYFTFGVNRIQRKARQLRSGLGQLDSSAGRRPRR